MHLIYTRPSLAITSLPVSLFYFCMFFFQPISTYYPCTFILTSSANTPATFSLVPASYSSYHPTAGALPHQPRRPPDLPLVYPLHHYTTYSALLAILPLAPARTRLADLYFQGPDNALNTWALQPELNQVTARSREH